MVILAVLGGPEVGLLALQAESYAQVSPYPPDVPIAGSAGMIGSLLDQGLTNRMPDTSDATR